MSVIISHDLFIKEGFDKNIQQLLLSDGIISEKTIYRYNCGETTVIGKTFKNVLDVALCDKDIAYEGIDKKYRRMEDVACKSKYPDYKERLNSHLSHGWEIDPDENSEGCFRRIWDKRAYDSLAFEPVMLYEDGSISWKHNYFYNDRPAFAVSKHYPDITFEYIVFSEGTTVYHFLIKNGEVIEDFAQDYEEENE